MSVAFDLQDVTLGYQRRPAVHHLSGQFKSGSLTAVVGPNGSGKSTLLKGLMGLLRPLDGRIDRHGVRRTAIAYLPQQSDIDRSFPISVIDTVILGHWRSIGLFRRVTPALRHQAEEALISVGLQGFAQRQIGSLSAGQFQRVLFARMLLQDAPIVLLDEPFTAIDSKTTMDLIGVLRRWHAEQRTVIAVLHDIDQVRENFPETLLLARESVAWGATAETLRGEHLFTARRMAEAWDDRAAVCRRGFP